MVELAEGRVDFRVDTATSVAAVRSTDSFIDAQPDRHQSAYSKGASV